MNIPLIFPMLVGCLEYELENSVGGLQLVQVSNGKLGIVMHGNTNNPERDNLGSI